jgi:hypothetical protein
MTLPGEELFELSCIVDRLIEYPEDAHRYTGHMARLIDAEIGRRRTGEPGPEKAQKVVPKKLCGCGRPIRAKGLCFRCYQRVRNGKEPVVDSGINLGGRPVKWRRCKYCQQKMWASQLHRHARKCPSRLHVA